MPRTRLDLERGDKVNEVLGAAERLVLQGGYAQLSMAAIARELGVAQNAVYWYFPTKDDLFVAVLRRLIGGVLAHKPPPSRGLVAQLLWFVDQLADHASLRAALRERAQRSDAAASFSAELDQAEWGLLLHGLQPHVAPHRLELVARTLLATIEGALALELTKRQRHAVLRHALDRLVG